MAQPSMPAVGFLNSGSPNERAHLVEAFRQGLKEGRAERLPKLATELVERDVAVIVALWSGPIPV